MAKSGVFEGSQQATAVAKAMDLKKELQRLANAIVVDEDDDVGLENIDRAHQVLCALKEMNVKKTQSLKVNDCHNMVSGSVPEEFKCPLSKELMREPVIVSTGQTYDRPFIEKWLKSGNRTCPRTQQVLSHALLTPNTSIGELISQWCKNRGVKLPEYPQPASHHQALTEPERLHFHSLLNKMSSSSSPLPEQKEAARELRLLTKKSPPFRALFGESTNAIPQLLHPLSHNRHVTAPDLQEDIVTTLLNLSIHDSNKKLVAEAPAVIPLLTEALKSGTVGTKTNSAATLFTLSALDSNKSLIGKSGALKPLIELLQEGHPLAMRDVASAIFNLCILHENKVRAVRDGAVRAILEKIIDRVHVDELLSILAMLSTNRVAVEEVGELGGVSCLLGVMRETSCDRNKENCIAILHAICFGDRTKWREMREEERVHGTISKLARDGTSRAKRKARGILERLNRAVNLTHTA